MSKLNSGPARHGRARRRTAATIFAAGALMLSSGLVVIGATSATAIDGNGHGKSSAVKPDHSKKPEKDADKGKPDTSNSNKPDAPGKAAAPDAGSGIHKSYVCKYVAKPGEAERLQTGQNPIWVDNNAIKGYDGSTPVANGDEFIDGHEKSVVLYANVAKMKPEPGIDQCSSPKPPDGATPLPPTATVSGCVPTGTTTGTLVVTVRNTADTGKSVVYTVTRDGTSAGSTGSVSDGSAGTVSVAGLTAGVHHFTIKGSDGTETSVDATLTACSGDSTASPTASASSQGCVPPGRNSGSIVVGVTNTDDATNDEVVYTIALGATSQQLTLADGASGSVTFTGLAPGNYTASVSGDDTTSASASATVAECNDQSTPPKDVCPNIAGIQKTLPKGLVITGNGDCLAPTVAGTETAKPGPNGPKPGVNKPGTTARPAVVAGTQAAIPTGADAGLATMPTASSGSVTTLLAQLLVAGGLLLLVTGGCIGLGRRTRGVHEA